MNISSPGDVLGAIFARGPQAGPAEVMIGPCDRPEPEPGLEAEAGL